jgi:hypothetical protein
MVQAAAQANSKPRWLRAQPQPYRSKLRRSNALRVSDMRLQRIPRNHLYLESRLRYAREPFRYWPDSRCATDRTSPVVDESSSPAAVVRTIRAPAGGRPRGCHTSGARSRGGRQSRGSLARSSPAILSGFSWSENHQARHRLQATRLIDTTGARAVLTLARLAIHTLYR